MDTSRTVINIIDNSETFEQNNTVISGFTVIKAPKGPKTPIRVPANSGDILQDVFGVSSEEYPDLYEAEIFNTGYDLYISAPYDEDGTKVPVAYVTDFGIVQGAETVPYTDAIEAYALGETTDIEGGAVGITSFEGLDSLYTLLETAHPERYGCAKKGLDKNNLIPSVGKGYSLSGESAKEVEGLLIHTGLTPKGLWDAEEDTGYIFPGEGVRILSSKNFDYTIDVNDNNAVYLKKKDDTSGDEKGILVIKKTVDNVEKYYNLTTEDKTSEAEILILVYDEEIINISNPEVRKSIKTYWVKSLESSNIHAVIFPKYPSERSIHITFADFNENQNYSSDDPLDWNILNMTVSESDASRSVSFKGSLNVADKDHGSFIGFTELNDTYRIQNFICVYVVSPFTVDSKITSGIKGFGSVDLVGGTRVTDYDDLYKDGWEEAGKSEYSDVDIFFDSEIHEVTSIDSSDDKSPEPCKAFLSLASDGTTTHELAGYIFNRTLKPSILEDDDEDSTTSIGSCKNVYGYNYWNVCNIGIVGDSKNGTSFPVAMTGSRALMQARILEKKLGGVAPMWENTSVGGVALGGQIYLSNIRSLKYRYTKKQLDILDDLNYNPVINDRQYGIMVVGQKTSKSGKATDWSYIGHTAAFLNFLKEVRANVMIPQIGKPNNPYYRALRKDQVMAALGKRINGSDRIWAEAECDTSTASGVNDVYALKARKFVIKVRVKVDVFSEKVELNFTNEGQDTIINTAQ